MDPMQSTPDLQSKKEQLWHGNDQLKVKLGAYKENLRSRLQGFSNDTLAFTVCSSPETEPSSRWTKTIDEEQFQKDLQQTKFKHEHRTSSPVDFKTFIQSSMNTDSKEKPEQSSQTDIPIKISDPDRLLGEIAFQLDRRILSYVFQGQMRLYGFTMLNIPNKINEVSTHPLTGKVDEGYRLHLTQRYADLMETMEQLGYKVALHPPFTEFIVNTYGILKERPNEHSTLESDFNYPDFLRTMIMITAPRPLQKDLLVVLTCLCSMAEKDKKPLFLY